LVDTLRERTRQLRERRVETAALAVAADRTRIGSDIGPVLRERVGEIDRLVTGPRPDFAAIELVGRGILDSMREVVGVLRDAPTAPEASLDELPDLLARDTLADTRLEISGERRTLPATVELTAYRVVEHALTALRDDAAARIDVLVRYGADRLELRLSGPPAEVDPRSVRSVVRARLALYGGGVDIRDDDGVRVASVWLPLVSPHA
jgi:glucose-6-phosphate-specific signal transduction histidine kinase